MNLSQLAQKNRRIKFWREVIVNGALVEGQTMEMKELLGQYLEILNRLSLSATDPNSVISDKDSLNMCNLERKLERLAESARLESGKSSLLI